jgi:5-methylcytosine-specific restriction endonuclease McrA
MPSSDKAEHNGRRSKDWLNTSRWQRLRLKVLVRDQYLCQQTGAVLSGKHPAPNSPVVDHIVPHRGDPDLFWDEDNLQSVSKAWHDSEKQSLEKRGLA